VNLAEHVLASLHPWRDAPGWVVALSGGLDSTVLLHVLATLSRKHALPPIRAIHVHHGLQAVAQGWPAHCAKLCEPLGIPFQTLAVQVAPGASLEQAARQARYAALGAALGEREVLLTGQHQDDQAETLLLRLLRGAGVRGAAAMPSHRPLGRGVLYRPLLDVSRTVLEDYAKSAGLSWINDPSNQDLRHQRNYLRHDVIPRLTSCWPAASQNLARSAGHFAQALDLLEAVALDDLAPARDTPPFPWLPLPSLALAPLRALSEARQRNALQAWLAPLTRLPDTAHWAGWSAVRDAAGDAQPLWALADGTLCRAGGRVWWLAGAWQHAPQAPPVWANATAPLALPGNGTLFWDGPAFSGDLRVRYRQGGERLTLAHRRRDLKRLLNEAKIPGFVRGRLPLLFADGHLVAVANLPALTSVPGQLRWQPPTVDRVFEMKGAFR